MARSTDAPSPQRRRAGLSIGVKALLVFVVVAVAPSLATALWLVSIDKDAVVQSEQQLQASIVAEVAADLGRRAAAVRADAEAIALAIEAASEAPAAPQGGDGADGLDGVRALLATRKAIEAARFEVPAAKVSTVLSRGARKGDAPESTPALRRDADERGAAFAIASATEGVVVVPIPKRAGAKGARGYVTAAVSFADLGRELTTIADARFPGESASLVVVDGARRVVGATGVPNASPGSSAVELPVFATMPSGVPWTERVAIVAEVKDPASPSVGAVETVPALGWAVAIWRPKTVAYAALERMRALGLVAAMGGVALAVLVALLAARSITRPVLDLVGAARAIGERRFGDLAAPSGRTDELGQLDDAVHQMAEDLVAGERKMAEEARLRGDLSRFLGEELVERIVRGEHTLALGGQRAEITVLFADVVAFTPLAEGRAPEEIVALLNELFSVLGEVVFRHQGTVDKFMGDCIMAVWGAPVATPEHASRALAAAEDMMRFLETANASFVERYGVEVRLAIGVNSGAAIAGNVGSKKRMEYTVIGDVVNVAARLEAIAAPNQVLVGEATQALAGARFELALLGDEQLTGRAGATKVYALDLG
jgi:class 3 adenylate cyclase